MAQTALCSLHNVGMPSLGLGFEYSVIEDTLTAGH